jgi:hypothetical protein
MAGGEQVEVQVVVHDAGPERLQQAVKSLRSAGMEITDVAGELGLVMGRAERSHLAELRKVKGVSVEAARDVRVPPPDSPVQ